MGSVSGPMVRKDRQTGVLCQLSKKCGSEIGLISFPFFDKNRVIPTMPVEKVWHGTYVQNVVCLCRKTDFLVRVS